MSGAQPKTIYEDVRVAAGPTAVEWTERVQFERVYRNFIDMVKRLPYVQQVFYEGHAPVNARIWTLIAAPEFDPSPRRVIYKAQLDATSELNHPMTAFRLVNLREIEGDAEDILPEQRTVLY